MGFKGNVGLVEFLTTEEALIYKKIVRACVGKRHARKKIISSRISRRVKPDQPDQKKNKCNDSVGFSDSAGNQTRPKSAQTRPEPDQFDPKTRQSPPFDLAEVEELIRICERLKICLYLDNNGSLVVGESGGPDIPVDLAGALETHAEAIARLIGSLAGYSDPEHPCDTLCPGPYGEPMPWCEKGEHSDESIIARWRATLNPPETEQERAEIDRLAAADAELTDDEGEIPDSGEDDSDLPDPPGSEEPPIRLEMPKLPDVCPCGHARAAHDHEFKCAHCRCTALRRLALGRPEDDGEVL
jgi:hypothetical protein